MNETPPLHDPIAIALAEDIGPGDVTVEYFVDPAQRIRARIFAKENAVVAGAESPPRSSLVSIPRRSSTSSEPMEPSSLPETPFS